MWSQFIDETIFYVYCTDNYNTYCDPFQLAVWVYSLDLFLDIVQYCITLYDQK